MSTQVKKDRVRECGDKIIEGEIAKRHLKKQKLFK
jgi:hypothetical protein